jgi:Phosphotransferase enzyme family
VHPKQPTQPREALDTRGLVSCFMTNPSLENLESRITQASQKRVLRLEAVHGGGYSLALRLRAFFEDGTTAFVKVATSQELAQFLRTEHHVYSSLGKQDFLAAFYGWDDDGLNPLLILEDFGAAFCAPPWTTTRIDAVLTMLERVHQTSAPVKIPLLESPETREMLSGWKVVAENPAAFLSLGLCEADWLTEALPALLEAEAKTVLTGTDLLHLDVRSDNLCFPDDDRAVLVDWNWVSVGNGEFDLAAWLPSLQAEGGPPPETFLPNAAVWAAALSGFFASRAGLPAPEAAPAVRSVQCQQLATALPWAARALGLRVPKA